MDKPQGEAKAEAKRILVVEDEFITAMNLKADLTKLGYEVAAVVDSGEEAIAKAAELRPDLILMDIALAGQMSGIEAAIEIRKSLTIPAVYLTAHNEANTIAKAKKSEPFGFLPKPYTLTILISTIEMALCNSAADAARRRAAEETKALVHQLQVQQVELEAQGEELRESRAAMETLLERYTDLYDSAPVGYLSLDETGIILQINLAGARLLEGERTRLVGSRFESFVSNAYRLVFYAFLRQVFSSKGRESCDLELLSASSQHGLLHIEAVLAENGKECRVVAQDISERKRTEEMLIRSRDYYLKLFEHFPALIWRAGIDGKCDYFNRTWLDFTGRTLEQELGDGWVDGVHPDDLERCLAIYRDAFRQWEAFDMEYRLKYHDGSFRLIRDCGRPFYDLNDVFAGYIGNCYDISDQKKALEDLRQSEDRFRQLFERSDDAIILFDWQNCAIVDLNEMTETLFGFSRQELLGAGALLFFDPEQRQQFSNLVCGLHPTGSLQVDKTVMVKSDGTKLFVSVRGKKIALLNRQVVYCSFRDITRRIRLEEEAKTAQAKLIQADKMASLGLLVSGIAHEINNPNNWIMFNSELLAKAWQSAMPILNEYYEENGDFSLGDFQFSETREVFPRLFSGLVEGSGRIHAIVDKLKNFSRQDSGSTSERVDVNKVVLDAIEIVNHEIKKHCANFSMTAGCDLPLAQGNAQQIEQVVINLMMNALQALPDRARAIRVSTALGKDGERIVITVADEGCGMTAEVLNRLSEPFFTTKIKSGGTGLGLSISSSILRENQGEISFSSEPGKGTTVTVLLRIFPDSSIQVGGNTYDSHDKT